MTRAIILLLIPLTTAACWETGEKVCDLGDSRKCSCESGQRGFQICAITKDTYTDCHCAPAPLNSVPVTVGTLELETDPGTVVAWGDAGSYCDGNTTSGHDDWRLPTREELTQGFNDCTDQGGSLELCDQCTANAWCTGVSPTAYWTDTAAGTGEHLAVHPNDDSMERAWVQALPDDYELPVICVRTP